MQLHICTFSFNSLKMKRFSGVASEPEGRGGGRGPATGDGIARGNGDFVEGSLRGGDDRMTEFP